MKLKPDFGVEANGGVIFSQSKESGGRYFEVGTAAQGIISFPPHPYMTDCLMIK